MDLLIKNILDKQPGATRMAKELGSFVSPRIKHLATNEDAVVREIAIRCLTQSGGDGVTDVLVNALLDESPSVRAAALGGLRHRLDAKTYPQLLQAYERVLDPQHRQEIALLIGRIDGAKVNDLRRICDKEQVPEAREGCVAALAKLGDHKAQKEFVRLLHASSGRHRRRFLEYVDYIHQTWVLKDLLPVLDDKSPLTHIGVDDVPGPGPEYLRACDIVINLIAEIGGLNFSFPVNRKTNYSDVQVDEVRRALLRSITL